MHFRFSKAHSNFHSLKCIELKLCTYLYRVMVSEELKLCTRIACCLAGIEAVHMYTTI